MEEDEKAEGRADVSDSDSDSVVCVGVGAYVGRGIPELILDERCPERCETIQDNMVEPT